ncbi:MAG TPA: response regulator [Gaiellaceae bacterium]|nr:response regulator [Gaiellaceae bacterium]
MAELVLIVDDNEPNLKLAREVLERAGMRTLPASTAAEGIRLACEHRPDVVLMDLRLPDLDGAEAVRRLAADERTAAIPVLAVSSLTSEEAGPWYRDAGFAGYVEKPIDVRDFAARVRAAVAATAG